ncbi:MAG: Aspartate--tRNA ligase [Microgenomates bacterium OLB23]|nr:MAG: Aspartate--tRNA ligase [Microgenomates bacterium OLB23]
MRDASGFVQVVGGAELSGITPESVLFVKGLVKERPAHMVNDKIATGAIEIELQEHKVISPSKPMPLPIDDDGYKIDEEVRAQYRYLDLRRPRMARNVKIRAQVVQFIRNFLSEKHFTEIETPILTKTSPEAPEILLFLHAFNQESFMHYLNLPSNTNNCLWLQVLNDIFKLPAALETKTHEKDRAYGEFTQLDIEMSFVEQHDILELIEEMFTKLVVELFPEKHITQSPWPRISHKEAQETYGNDKPDLRKNPQDPNELAFAWILDFPLFTEQSEDDFYHGAGSAKYAPSHHMFTAPHPDDIELLSSNPLKVRGLQHDLALNGLEVGGGSIRIHQPEVQSKIFDLIGFSDEQKLRFADMLEAFTYGVPPHGGIAPGIDRLLMALLNEPSVREVIPFPASASGKTAVMDAPSGVEASQLAELSIK